MHIYVQTVLKSVKIKVINYIHISTNNMLVFVVSSDVGRAVQELITDMKKMPMGRFREVTEKYGFKYGPTFSIIKEIWECDNEGLCRVEVNMAAKNGNYVVHPSILDACLQSCFIPLGSLLTDDKSIVPVGFKSITLNDVPSTNQLYCHVVADVTEFGKFDVTLMSPAGKVLLTMSEFRVEELTNSPRQLSFAELAYEVQWKEEDIPGQSKSTPNFACMVLMDSSNFSDGLVTRLRTVEVNVIPVKPPNGSCFNGDAEEAIKTAFGKIPSQSLTKLRVINLWPLEASSLPEKFEIVEQIQRLAFSSSVFLMKLLRDKDLIDSRLFLVTERTQLMYDYDQSLQMTSIPWGSTVWGLRRTANLEEFNIRVTAVDLCNKEDEQDVHALVNEILCDSIEDEVAFRGGERFINRLLRSKMESEKTTVTTMKEHHNNSKSESLYLSALRSSRTLCLREQSLSKPSSSECAIDVHCCWTPSESLFELSKRNGCVFVSGQVNHVTEKSHHTFQAGDEVCGVIPAGRVSSSISINVSNLFVKPVSFTTEQATCIPACLAIASYALQRATSGFHQQKLLIHQANRGPGPAAVVLGKTLGHQVTCTISDTCKRSTTSLLLNLGADTVMRQSFSLHNSDSTGQFDAVIFFSAPPPNALRKSGRSLRKGGRVVILSYQFEGDVVFSANENVEYVRNDISDILLSPSVFEKLTFQSLETLESKGVLQKLLGTHIESADLIASIKVENGLLEKNASRKPEVKDSSDISFSVHSLRTFQGESDLQDIPVLPRGLDECGLKENRTYLVAGGLGGFGFEVAFWMAENGAKTIGILSRSKPSDTKRQELQQIERKTGAKIHTFQVSKVHIRTYVT